MSQEKLTVEAALGILSECGHGFLTNEGGQDLCAAFGVEPRSPETRVVDRPGTLRGFFAWDDNGKPLPVGSKVEGHSAELLALYLCDRLQVAVPRVIGRGSQLRYCVEALTAHFRRH